MLFRFAKFCTEALLFFYLSFSFLAREEYDNVAFLYVSDDMDWAFKNLEDKEGDLFLIGDGNEDPDGIAFDLSVLVNANHTIITRGTYSMWGAMLCGGEYYTEYGTIVPTDLQGH